MTAQMTLGRTAQLKTGSNPPQINPV